MIPNNNIYLIMSELLECTNEELQYLSNIPEVTNLNLIKIYAN